MIILQKKHYVLLSTGGVRLDDLKRSLPILNDSVILYVFKDFLIIKLAVAFFELFQEYKKQLLFLSDRCTVTPDYINLTVHNFSSFIICFCL